MSRLQFLLPNVAPGTRVRFDTVSGSNSAADIVNNLNQAVAGSIITADSSGRLASGDIYGPSGVSALYMKTLDGGGNPTGSPTTLTASHAPPVNAAYSPLSAAVAATRTLQVVATRSNNLYNNLSGSYPLAAAPRSFLTKHIATANITSLVLGYGNWYGSTGGPQGDGPGDLVVGCSVMIGGSAAARGVTWRGSFAGGARQATIKAGATAFTDPIEVNIAKGTAFFVWTFVSSGNYPVGIQTNYAKGKGVDTIGDGNITDSGEGSGSGDLTASGTTTTFQDNPYSPCILLGTTKDGAVPTVAISGDSIITGTNDFSDCGFAWRALNNQFGYLKVSQPAETAANFALNGYAASLTEGRQRQVKYATHALCNYGRNDITTGRSAATIEGDLITIWTKFQALGVKAYQTTITPLVTTTDGYSTLGNQTVSGNNSVRLTLNAWLRDGAPMSTGAAVAVGTGGASRCAYYDATGTLVTAASGATHPLQGVFEVADVVESARDSGKFRVDTVRTVTDAAITTGTATLTSATANFVAGDFGKGVRIVGAGSAGGDITTAYIVKVNSATSVTISQNASTTVSGATASIGIPTGDGTHPMPDLHRLMAAAINTTLFTLP